MVKKNGSRLVSNVVGYRSYAAGFRGIYRAICCYARGGVSVCGFRVFFCHLVDYVFLEWIIACLNFLPRFARE